MRSFLKKIKENKKELLKKAVINSGVLFISLAVIAIVTLQPHTTHAFLGWHPLDDAGNAMLSALRWIIRELMQALLSLSGLIVWIAGQILETVIRVSIVDMGKYVNTPGIVAVWKTFRDLANMFFIFILLYAAIGTILDLSGVNWKRILKNIIIFSLLINFSFFFTKVAVDASNILTVGFYNQISQTQCGTKPAGDIGAAFMCKMGLTGFFGSELLEKAGGDDIGKIITIGIMGSIFMLVAAFVFLAAALMFVHRLITLILLFMFSPLAFASMALPKDKYSDEWTKPLINACIFPPVFMAVIWAVLKILSTLNFGGSGSLLDSIAAGSGSMPAPGAGNTLLNFIIVIGLLVGSLVVAQRLGAEGASGALKKITGYGKSAQAWTQGKLGRGAVRATGIRALDESFKNSEFGKSRIGNNLRSFTTGAITGQKFGSKESVSSMDKKLGKIDEDWAKKRAESVGKDAETQADKDSKDTGLHKRNLDNVNNLLTNKNQQKQNLAAEKARLSTELTDVTLSPAELQKRKDRINQIGVEERNAEADIQGLEKKKTENASRLTIAKKMETGEYLSDEDQKFLKAQKEESIKNAKNDAADKLERKGKYAPKGIRRVAGITGKILTGADYGSSSGAVVGATTAGAIGLVTAGPGGAIAGALLGAKIGAGLGAASGAFWGYKGGAIGKRNLGPDKRKSLVDALRGKKKDGDKKTKDKLKESGWSDEDIEEMAKESGFEKKKE